MNIIEIENPNDFRILNYKSMRDNLIDFSGNSLFVAEGEKVVLKLFKSNISINSVFARKNFYDENSQIFNKFKNVDYFTANEEILKSIVGFKMHTGVMAIAQKPDLSNISDLSDTIVCLNGLVDSENIGSIVRNCVAFGVDSLIFDKSTSSPFMRRAVRVSMGTVFSLKIYQSMQIYEDLKLLKSSGYKIISAEICQNAKSINNFVFPPKKVLIFGSEAIGINQQIIDISDDVIYIPIDNKIESINVASSSAIFLSRIKI
jgi:tRNA G18 (ribose-2'-O)-methylase SpoU